MGGVDFLGRGWRAELAEVASIASRSLLVAAPFIKLGEAQWLCDQVRNGVEITTLAKIDSQAVGMSALDIAALRCLRQSSPAAELIALPNLHAKVFVADDKAAIVTSGNLTRSGIDRNIEYGVLFREPCLAGKVRSDMLRFAAMGSRVGPDALAEMEPLETELRRAWEEATADASSSARARFNDALQRAKPAFASAQVGDRSAHAVFGDAILFVLADGPLATKEIQSQVQELLPDLCDDTEYFSIKGEQYGRAWKRRLRHAQLHLKRRGELAYDASTRMWAIRS